MGLTYGSQKLLVILLNTIEDLPVVTVTYYVYCEAQNDLCNVFMNYTLPRLNY